MLQIPAFLCRQTDLLIAAGATGKPVNVKKGQWLQPDGMTGAVNKVIEGRKSAKTCPRAGEIAITERGTFFGYGDLVVDMRNFARLKVATHWPVIFDATHSVVRDRAGKGDGGSGGGVREMIPPLTFAALAAGADGLFLETHPDPAHAPSDGPNMIALENLDALVMKAVDIWAAARRADCAAGGQARGNSRLASMSQTA